MKNDFDCYKKPGAWRYTHDNTVIASNYEMMKVKLDAFLRANPSATAEDAKSFIEQWKNIRIPNTSINYASGEVERMVNGRVAIFSSDKKFIRWKDGK